MAQRTLEIRRAPYPLKGELFDVQISDVQILKQQCPVQKEPGFVVG
jgi:hypothetical protein